MSIVEKAVDRAGRKGQRPRRETLPAAPVEVVRRRGTGADGGVVELAAAREYDMRGFQLADTLQREFRFLKRPLLARVFGVSKSGAAPGGLVMITSCMPRAGKTFISFNLALSIAAEQMTEVLLVDADPVRRQLTDALGRLEAPGLTDVLADPDLDVADAILDTDSESLSFLPAGRPRADATELLAGRRMTDLLRSLARPDRVVLLDSPPMLITSEARALCEKVDHAVVVLAAGETGAGELTDALKTLDGTGASVSLILNKVSPGSQRNHREYYEY